MASRSGRRHLPGESDLFGNATSPSRRRHPGFGLSRKLRPGEVHGLARLSGGDSTTQSLQRRDPIDALGVVRGARQFAEPREDTIKRIDRT